MTGSYSVHAKEEERNAAHGSIEAMEWGSNEYIDIALELDFPRHLNTH
jgi:hypothetical protein